MKLKRFHIWMVLFVLLTPSVFCSWRSYHHVRQQLVADMNQALEKTLALQTSYEITPDTVRNYLSNLQIPELRERSFISYAIPNTDYMLCSERRRWADAPTYEYQSFASCSFASLWAMSDQRLSLFFFSLSVLWLLGATLYYNYEKRQPKAAAIRIGGIKLESDVFYNRSNRPIHLTPMQEQLLRMFFTSSNHHLSKQQICDALWPRKPDASETLYTLIKRLKPIVEEQGDLQISSERGKEYVLEKK